MPGAGARWPHRRDPEGRRRAQPNRDATIIDGSGLYFAPGLIDSHVHLGDIPGMTPEQEAQHPDIAKAARDQIPRSYLLYGFTTLIDLISTPQGMARWKSHDIAPDAYFCGGAALMDGYPMNYAPKPQRYQGLALYAHRARHPGARRDRSRPAHATGCGLKDEIRRCDLREDIL